jgi:hypothetical protein
VIAVEHFGLTPYRISKAGHNANRRQCNVQIKWSCGGAFHRRRSDGQSSHCRAVAQALTILLIIVRDREIKKLRELVNEQRLRITELKAWLAGRNAAQPRQIKSEREPMREPTREPMREPTREPMREPMREPIAKNNSAPEPAITSKDLPETIQPRATKDEAAEAMKALNWLKEIQSAKPRRMKPEPIAEPEPAITPKGLPDTIRASTTEDELKRAAKAINWLKEDADREHEIRTILQSGTPPKKIG